MNLKVRQDASNPFNRSLIILSLRLLADDASQACTLAMLTVLGYARTLGLHVQLARRARRTIVFAEGADREDYGFVQRLRLDVHGMPDAVGSGERNSAGAGGHVREDIIEGEETANMISSW